MLFMRKQVTSQQSWLEPTQSAKVQSTNCETEKCNEWNCKIQMAKCNYKSEMEWSTLAEPLSREILKEQSVPPDYSTREISHNMQSMIDRLKWSRKTKLVDTIDKPKLHSPQVLIETK